MSKTMLIGVMLLVSSVVSQGQTLTGTLSFGTIGTSGSATGCVSPQVPNGGAGWGGLESESSSPAGGVQLSVQQVTLNDRGPYGGPVQNTQMCATVTVSPLTSGTINGTLKLVYQGLGSSNLNVVYTVSGTAQIPTATATPKYQIMSILYDAPGNASSTGFSNATTAGATNSLQNNFSSSDTVQFSGGTTPGGFNGSVQYTTSTNSGNTQAYQTNYSASSGSQLNSPGQDIDHSQDQVFLWVNPTVTVTQTGNNTGYFSLGTLDSNGNFTNQDPMNIVNVSVAQMRNPSTIPLYALEPVTVSPGVTLPGLESICANPLPVAQCTQTNACGCVASDFAPLIAQDELASVTTQSEALNAVDPNRYVYLTNVVLEGPATGGSGTVKNTFSLTDGSQGCKTYSNGSSYSVGVTGGWKFPFTGFSLGISNTTSFTVSQTESSGTCNGQSHTGTVTTGSSVAGCYYDVDVYEDTIYHTFAYALPTAPSLPNNACSFTHN